MKILAVDDTLTDLQKIKQIIERAGHRVITAKDGAEALEKAIAEQPDMIFMDIVMPRMDGFKATRAIKSQDTTSHIPVILVSTKSKPEDVELAKRQGALMLISKPISPAQIIEQIAHYQSDSAYMARM